MPIPQPQIPNYNVAPVQTPDLLQKYGQMLSLKNMQAQSAEIPLDLQIKQQQQQQDQALAPIQLRAAAAQAQQQEAAAQQQQIGLQNAQKSQAYWTDPSKYEPAKTPDGAAGFAESMFGLDPNDPLTTHINGMVKAGVNPMVGANNVMETATGLMNFRKTVTAQTDAEQKVTKEGLAEIKSILTPIAAEPDPAKQAQMLQDAAPELAKQSTFDPSLHQSIMGLDVAHLPKVVNLVGALGDVTDYATKQANAQKVALEVAPVTPEQLNTFTTQTIPSYTNLSPAQQKAAISEAKEASTIPDFNKVVARWDATDKAEQMHADSLAQTKALVGNKFAEAGLTANDKNWSDPQHGYLQIASQAKLALQTIQAGANGDGLATSLAPTMEILGVNNFAQSRRITPAEAQAAGMPGGYAERFNAWFTKAATGKLSPQVAAEGQQLMNGIVDTAYSRAVQSSQMTAVSHGLTPAQTPAFDKAGNVTTLDKIIGPGTPAAPAASGAGKSTPAAAVPPPTGKVTVFDPNGVQHFVNASSVKQFLADPKYAGWHQ